MDRPEVVVVENGPSRDIRRLGTWLSTAGVDLRVVRPHAGDDLPETLGASGGLIVLGGGQDSFGQPEDTGAPWFDQLQTLFREAIERELPTLGICLGGQLLALATGGTVTRSAHGFQAGPQQMTRCPAAATDPLFAELSATFPVISWHRDEITALPPGAELLATSEQQPHQAFRVGQRAWGLQFHIECDTPMLTSWAGRTTTVHNKAELVQRCDTAMTDLDDVWRPFAARFARLVHQHSDADLDSQPTTAVAHPRAITGHPTDT